MAERVYNLIDGGRKYGPYSKHELATMLAGEEIALETLCIRSGDGEICEVGELFGDRQVAPEEDEEEDDDDDDDDEFEEVAWEDGIWYADDDDDDDDVVVNEGPVRTADDKAARAEKDSDEIICRLHPSILGYPKLLVTMIVVGAGSLGLLFLGPLVGLPGDSLSSLGFGLAGLVFMFLLAMRYFDNYYISRTRAEVVHGWIAKSSKEVRLADIRRIDVDKKGWRGLLNVGDVKLSSAGTGGFDVVFANVKAGHRLKKVLRRVQKEPNASKRYLLHGKSWLRRLK